jgi:hypothetical protein
MIGHSINVERLAFKFSQDPAHVRKHLVAPVSGQEGNPIFRAENAVQNETGVCVTHGAFSLCKDESEG